MSALTISGLRKSFGGLNVTRDVNLSVEPGERRLIIGPNGAGKTTVFNLLTGLYKPSTGRVAFDGKDVTGMSPQDRNIAMVYPLRRGQFPAGAVDLNGDDW